MRNILKHVKTYAILNLVGSLCLLASNAFASQESSLNASIQHTIRNFAQDNHLAGLVVCYQFKSQSIVTIPYGYQNVEKKIPMSQNSYFEIGSITKSFLSAMLMQQVALKKIQLDETLGKVAEQFPGKNGQLLKLIHQHSHLAKITLREYLTHTSGIAQSLNSKIFMAAYNKDPMDFWSATQLINIAMQHPPYFSPGEKGLYGYTNTDYEIMGLVLEAITSKSLLQNMTTFFEKLGLKHIYFLSAGGANLPISATKNIAQAYALPKSNYFMMKAFEKAPIVHFQNGQKARNLTKYAINYASIAAASGGIITRPSTLVAWYWRLFGGKAIPAKYLPEMLRGVPTADPTKKYGLGIVVQSTKKYRTIYSHDGIMYGYSANLLYLPSMHLVFSVAINTSTQDSNLVNKLVSALITIFAEHKENAKR